MRPKAIDSQSANAFYPDEFSDWVKPSNKRRIQKKKEPFAGCTGKSFPGGA
jgi:hypothetical protein